MKHEQASELLAAYADGGLEGREQDAVATHVAGCARCAAEVRALRSFLGDTRQAGAPAPRDELFWQGLARDIRVAVDDHKPHVPWWRAPLLGLSFALAATAVVWVAIRGPLPAPRGAGVATAPRVSAPLPPSFDIEDLDADALSTVAAALDAAPASSEVEDEELAVASPASPETLVENLDDNAVTRLAAAL
jgi:anti-sigma factor RsiW